MMDCLSGLVLILMPILKKTISINPIAGLGILTTTPFRVAYEKAEEFVNYFRKEQKSGVS
jgi:hypothetical protein